MRLPSGLPTPPISASWIASERKHKPKLALDNNVLLWYTVLLKSIMV